MTHLRRLMLAALLLILFADAPTASAADLDWTFVKGSGDYVGEYRLYNDPNLAYHHPGSRTNAVSWTDTDGNLWLFGGYNNWELSGWVYLNDLWKFNSSSGTWILIEDYATDYGVYNDPNPANNHPGWRSDAAAWTDTDGNLWLFGGFNYLASGNGSLNDLWKFDPTSGNWTFVKGSGDYQDEYGVYTDPNPANNHPGSREGAITWTDASGNLWLFGGHGYAASGSSGSLNDLWKFDPSTNNWTFVKGSGDYLAEPGVYNDPNPANNQPGSRYDAVSWTDASGNFWLFGGIGYAALSSGYLNDLWKFDPSSGNWTFVKGTGDYLNEPAVYNDPNPANNNPGSKFGAVSWIDTSDNLWLFGGGSNDLWKFDPITGYWILVKGNYYSGYGVYDDSNPANNHPGLRYDAVSWTDASGNFWLFGGFGYAASGEDGLLNDVWKLELGDPTLVVDSSGADSGAITATGIACTFIAGRESGDCAETVASGTAFTITVAANGDVSFEGWTGCDSTSGTNGDTCHVTLTSDTTVTAEFSILNWTFVSGTGDYVAEPAVYNDPNPTNNHPGSRVLAATWTDASGSLWLFGGNDRFDIEGPETARLNDLWKYDPTTDIWTFIKGSGDSIDEYGVYNDPNPANNHPGSRAGVAIWIDSDGNLWLFGGHGYAASGLGYLNDLWKFNPSTNNWTFVKGTGDYLSELPAYNDPNPANNSPGSDFQPVSWIDASGNLCLFSSLGMDVWKFDPNTGNWILVKGDYSNFYGVYNDPNPANNHPGWRYGSVSWTDASGNLWLFGGWGRAASYEGYLNDLWKFNPSTNNWTFVKGYGDYADEFGVYTDPNPANNIPGSRAFAAAFTGIDGSLWLFSGDGFGEGHSGDSGVLYYKLTDLWKFDPASGNWTFVKGSPLNEFGIYNDPNPANIRPGSRAGAVSWTDAYGNFWLFGGSGNAESPNEGTLNDLWKFDPTPGIFEDIPVVDKEWMQKWIEQFYTLGLTTGCGANPLRYCPEREVTRAEMAVFIIRALHYPSLPYTPTDPDDHFADVPVVSKEWMRPWIEEFYDLGLTTGCAANPLRFCPEREVTRAEMAVFILRALEGGNYQPPTASHYFDDVPVAGKAWMEAWIDEFYRRGITTGCAANPLQFCPEREVTRAEMAVFILRAFDNLPQP